MTTPPTADPKPARGRPRRKTERKVTVNLYAPESFLTRVEGYADARKISRSQAIVELAAASLRAWEDE